MTLEQYKIMLRQRQVTTERAVKSTQEAAAQLVKMIQLRNQQHERATANTK